MKNFKEWGEQKELTENKEINRWCQPRDIWWCKMGVNIGYEEDGKGEHFLRPVVVLKNFGINTALVVALTTSKKKNRFHFAINSFDGESSFAIISQIKLIDTKRLVEKKGKVEKGVFENLEQAIKDLF